MSILDRINTPADLRGLSQAQLEDLATEIREFLVQKVTATGGHLGPNLGVVELTLALHRVFDSPTDPILFDTGHQAYVHKIVTGRKDQFDTLRQEGGLSGYPCRAESAHDWLESSHASAALSQADGLAKAFEIQGQSHRHVAVVVGDGALTGGMCWEALNNIAEGRRRSVVVVVNDNGRSYAPTIGGLAQNLAALRLQPAYDFVMDQGKNMLGRMGWMGDKTFQALKGMKAGLRHTVIPHEMFSDLGLKYIGPVDGHDEKAVENALRFAKDYGGPVIVHTVTQKGRGYAPAENHEADQMHGIGQINPDTGKPLTVSKPGWTKVFSDELIKIGYQRPDVVAITAAMAGPTGIADFGEVFPSRTFDVGIAEQHAVASAAGLAMGGLHPVVAVYSTFLNRAFDQLLMDVALIKQPVTLVLDRSGITGDDGASHNGMWDLAVCGIVPGIRVAAPRDEVRLRQALREAVDIKDGPTVVRFPKGALPAVVDPVKTLYDGAEILYRTAGGSEGSENSANTGADTVKVLVVAVGPFAGSAVQIAGDLEAAGLSVTVLDPRWVLPVGQDVVSQAKEHDMVVVWEDGVIQGGVGASTRDALVAAGCDVPVRQLAVPDEFVDHAKRADILARMGLDAQGACRRIIDWAQAL